MKKCNRCGSFVADSAKFCTECGFRLIDTKNTPIERIREWKDSQQRENNTVFQMSSTSNQVVTNSKQRMKDQNIAQYFLPTYDPAPYCKFNDRTKKMLVADRVHISYEPKHYTVFNYDQIISYELLEDGGSIASGGLGRAAVGGFLFGGVGAVVGGLTRSYKGACTSLQIKLTVKDYDEPAFFITLIDSATKKDSVAYKKYIKEAESIISKLKLIVGNREAAYVERPSANTESVADQIRSFKALLDDGIITQEEFEAKKKQLLGI